MSFTNQTQTNTTTGLKRHGILGLVFSVVTTTVPFCVFLFINVTMLFTLRSKTVFQETSRFVLLFNLLFADTLQLAHSQVMFLLSAARVTLLYPVCVVVIVLNTNNASNLTLVMMCLERYVAVCYPLRHNAIITVRNTGVVIGVVWTFTSINIVIQIWLIFKFLQRIKLQHMQMTDFCGKDSVFLDPLSELYEKASTYFIFALAGVAVGFSYISIIVAARSASTDKASANKARKTLLLHLVQLGLSMSSIVHNSLLIMISKNLDRLTALRLQIVIYVAVFVFPKCLSSLIYGLRDQTIKPVLMFNLSCRCRGSSLLL